MRANSDRWAEVTPSRHAHERAGLDYVRERLPDADPYRAWSNLEVVTPRGESLEVDLLVLGPAGLYLDELKSWTGRIRGNSYQWIREDRHRTVVDSPFISANHKARVLKSLCSQLAGARVLVPDVPCRPVSTRNGLPTLTSPHTAVRRRSAAGAPDGSSG
jgi:hypothetical protein